MQTRDRTQLIGYWFHRSGPSFRPEYAWACMSTDVSRDDQHLREERSSSQRFLFFLFP